MPKVKIYDDKIIEQMSADRERANIPIRNVSAIAATAKVNGGKTKTDRRKVISSANLVRTMDLDEMLEASKVVEMGIKGEKLPVVQSSKVKKYAGVVLGLNKSLSTQHIARKMLQELNMQIIQKNRNTTDALEAKRIYQEFIAEK